jgi:DNA-directed RNA polymerase subunit RPC12/RpoP
MPFCPKCRDEYRQRISECPYCGARLIDKLREETNGNTAGTNTKQNDFVFLRSFPSGLYACMLQGALENEGIPSMIRSPGEKTTIVDFDCSADKLENFEASIWVPKKDYQTCKEISDLMFEDI